MPKPNGCLGGQEVEDRGADVAGGGRERGGGRGRGGKEGAACVSESLRSPWTGATAVDFLEKSALRV